MLTANGASEGVKGVYSLKEEAAADAGGAAETFYYAREKTPGVMSMQALNENFVPSGKVTSISNEEFAAAYVPRPEVYEKKTLPAMRALRRAVSKGERHRGEGDLYSAEYEFEMALKVDAENIRVLFGLGRTYLDQGKTDQAHEIFDKIMVQDSAFDVKHMHLFNEFGIKLRKNKMYDQALKYYAKALKMSKDDEHIMYNVARTFFEKGNPDKAMVFLKKALTINPAFKEGWDFLAFIEKKIQGD